MAQIRQRKPLAPGLCPLPRQQPLPVGGEEGGHPLVGARHNGCNKMELQDRRLRLKSIHNQQLQTSGPRIIALWLPFLQLFSHLNVTWAQHLQLAGERLVAERQVCHAVCLHKLQHLHQLPALSIRYEIFQYQVCQSSGLRDDQIRASLSSCVVCWSRCAAVCRTRNCTCEPHTWNSQLQSEASSAEKLFQVAVKPLHGEASAGGSIETAFAIKSRHVHNVVQTTAA